MSLADVKEVLRVGKVGAPKSWLHACAQLEHWSVVMATLLGAGHEAVAWLLSLTRSKALVYDRQAIADPKLPLAVLARIHLTFYAFFESVQGGGPALLPDLSTLIRELRERRLICPRLPPSMQGLIAGSGGKELYRRRQLQPCPQAPDWPRQKSGVLHPNSRLRRRAHSTGQRRTAPFLPRLSLRRPVQC
jgi:hypothetical protein